jgi:hypothetical protein
MLRLLLGARNGLCEHSAAAGSQMEPTFDIFSKTSDEDTILG